NVHEVRFEQADADTSVDLDSVLTPALKREVAARELIRTIYDLRKQAGLTINDRITVQFVTSAEFWRETLAEHGNELLGDVKADAFEQVETLADDGSAELENDGSKIRVAVVKK